MRGTMSDNLNKTQGKEKGAENFATEIRKR